MNTKEKILEAALLKFSEKGYDGTSMEQIAKSVGIKAPSLYKHYKGKEDIMEELINAAERRYEEFFGSERNLGDIPDSKEEFLRSTMGKISFTINDQMIRRTRMFLVQEQFRSERLAEVTTRHQLDGIQLMYTGIIKAMMEKDLVVKDDPAMLAVELTGPVVVLIAKADRQPGCTQEILERIEKHVRHFCDVYMK